MFTITDWIYAIAASLLELLNKIRKVNFFILTIDSYDEYGAEWIR